MKLFRLIIFYIFLLSYLVACPLIIMYVRGRVLNPDTQKIINTGLIYIDSVPEATAVWLNETRRADATPATIRNLPPGNYSLTLTRNRYRPYKKTVTVLTNKAIPLDRILLIPDSWHPRELSDTEWEDLMCLEATPFLLLRKGRLLSDLFILKLYDALEEALQTGPIIPVKQFHPYPLLPSDSAYADFRFRRIFTVAGSSLCIISGENDGRTCFLAVNSKNADNAVTDISALFPQEPKQILWDSVDETTLFSLQSGYLNRLDLQDKAIYPQIIPNVRSYTIFDNEIYTLRANAPFCAWDYKGNEKIFTAEVSGILSRIPDSGPVRIRMLNKKTLLCLDGIGRLRLNRPSLELSGRTVRGFSWDKKRSALLLWTGKSIAQVEIGRDATDKAEDAAAESLRWIVSGKKNITRAEWIYKGSHVLFTDTDTLYLTETAPGGQEREIVPIKKGTSAYYSEVTGNIYYLNAETSRLNALELIPPHAGIPQAIITEEKTIMKKKPDL